MTNAATILSDQAARDRIRGLEPADLDRSFAIEAGAGSGKTTQLVERLVALAEREDPRGEMEDPLGEVVAISFTNRAAAELRAQAYRGLAGRAAALTSAGVDAPRLARVRRALAGLDAACIDTIHGFCGRILRAEALAIGLPPDYAVLDEREAEEERLAFWRRHAARTPDDEIAAVGLSPTDVKPLFERLCGRMDRLPRPYGATLPDLAPAAALAAERLAEWQALRDGPAGGARDDLQAALDRAGRLREYRGLDGALDRARFLEAVLRGYDERGRRGRVREERWPDADRARTLASIDVPGLAEQILPAYRQWQAYAYDRALEYAREALEVFRRERLAAGRITQDDVLLLTAKLLREQPRVRRRAAERYRRILVDEFQDTDPIQAEILFLIAAEDADRLDPVADWRATRPRPGSLFLVGDPKQAIYRFRGADIQTYAEARRVLLEAGGEALGLTTCFRSLPSICDWVNQCLSPSFALDAGDAGGAARQAPYVPLVSGRAAAGPDQPYVARIDVRPMSRPRADIVAARDSIEIARFIRAAVDRRADPAVYAREAGDPSAVFGDTARYGDFLILCRSAYRFRRYANALEELGIPYAFAGDKGLGESAELRAFVDLLDVIRDPLDGPVVIAQRTGLLGGLDTATLVGTYRDGLTRDAAVRVEEVRALCRAAREALDTLPLAAAFEWIVQRTGLLSVAAGRDRGASTRSGSLLKVLALARSYESAGLHWTEALDRLREVVNGHRKDGRITLEEGAPDAVRIMTLHQAKGLQSPVVFLADPYTSYDPGPSEHAGRTEAGTPFLTAPLTAGGEFTTRVLAAPARWFAVDEAEERRFDEAERRRLAYVAATRAKGLLVVSRYLGPRRSLVGSGSWGLFHEGLDQAPQLKDLFVATRPAPAGEAPAAEGVARDFAAERREALAAAVVPSYRAGAVTAGDFETDEEVAVWERAGGDARRAGHGAPFGTAVHSLFDWAIRWRHSDTLWSAAPERIARLWLEFNPNVPQAEAVRALDGLRGSDLWRRLLAAENVLTESPVAGLESAGAIDLAYCDAAGWHLVDFKTDVAIDESTAAATVERHADQVRAYGAIWAAATGRPPASLSVYLTDTGRCYGVSGQ